MSSVDLWGQQCDCPQDCAKSDMKVEEHVMPLDLSEECGSYEAPMQKWLREELGRWVGSSVYTSYPISLGRQECRDIARKDVAVLVLKHGADTVPVWHRVNSLSQIRGKIW